MSQIRGLWLGTLAFLIAMLAAQTFMGLASAAMSEYGKWDVNDDHSVTITEPRLNYGGGYPTPIAMATRPDTVCKLFGFDVAVARALEAVADEKMVVILRDDNPIFGTYVDHQPGVYQSITCTCPSSAPVAR